MADDAKRMILARRARYMAAAVAGLAATGCAKSSATADAVDAGTVAIDTATAPHPCLSPPVHRRQEDAAPIDPEVLALLAALGNLDAGADTAADAAADAEDDATRKKGK